jgi:hypothetical protein
MLKHNNTKKTTEQFIELCLIIVYQKQQNKQI